MPTIQTLLQSEIKRRLIEEGIARIKKCLTQLDNKQIWYRPNANSNSIGNLILHLDGNVRQWLIATFMGIPDRRDRPKEFDQDQHIDASDLHKMLDRLAVDINVCIEHVVAEKLPQTYIVQGFEEKGLSIVIHVIEHYSYHVGQISYITKMLLGIDLGYYEGIELDVNAKK